MTAELPVGIALVDQLSKEHDEVRSLLSGIEDLTAHNDLGGAVDHILSGSAVIGEALDEHIVAEDETLFPALASEMGQELLNGFIEEHVRIKQLRDLVISSARANNLSVGETEEFCQVLREHMDKEDMMLFPSARELLS